MSCENKELISFGQLFIPKRNRDQAVHVVTDSQIGEYVAGGRLFKYMLPTGQEVTRMEAPGIFDPQDVGRCLGHMTAGQVYEAFVPERGRGRHKKPPRELIKEVLSQNAQKPPRRRF